MPTNGFSLQAINNPRSVDVPLKSINHSKKTKLKNNAICKALIFKAGFETTFLLLSSAVLAKIYETRFKIKKKQKREPIDLNCRYFGDKVEFMYIVRYIHTYREITNLIYRDKRRIAK